MKVQRSSREAGGFQCRRSSRRKTAIVRGGRVPVMAIQRSHTQVVTVTARGQSMKR